METKQFNLKLSEKELNVIINALITQPFKDVNELIQNIINQVNIQAQPQPVITEEVNDKADLKVKK